MIIDALGEAAAFLAFWCLVSVVTAVGWGKWREACKRLSARSVDRRAP